MKELVSCVSSLHHHLDQPNLLNELVAALLTEVCQACVKNIGVPACGVSDWTHCAEID